MGFCSYSKEFSLSSYTNIENQFINKYMALADGDAVKVYIFGLYLCQNVQETYSVSEAARTLNMSEEKIVDSFRFWEDFDLLEIVSLDPFSVRYFPADYSKGKPKRIRTEKYADFNKAVQSMMPKKMITPGEFEKYFAFMEQYAVKPEALILIVKYCVDLKGESISQNYILQVAKNFASEGVTTVEQVEEKLSDYVLRSGDIASVLRAMGSTKKPDPDDYKLLKKWTEEMGFETDTVRFVASLHKKSSLSKLDEALSELYANKKFGETEIRDYLSRKAEIRALTLQIARELGVYCQIADPFIDNFVSGWLSAGYEDASLLSLAKYCFRRDRRSFEKMDELIKKLLSVGVVSADSIVSYMQAEAQEQEFAARVLKTAGLERRVNNWDRDCLKNWRGWNFSDEMILKAAETAKGKNSPIPYITSVLSSWKAKNIFSPDQLEKQPAPDFKKQSEDKDAALRKKVQTYYFNLRERAQDKAEHYLRLARRDEDFKKNEDSLKAAEIRLAKAEALGGDASAAEKELSSLKAERKTLLKKLGITEEMLTPQYKCKICNDTGFDKNGNVCACYKKFVEEAGEQERLSNIIDAYSNIEI